MMAPVVSDTEETRYGRLLDWQLLTRFLRYTRPYTGWLALAFILLPVNALLQMTQPMVIQQAIDHHLTTGHMVGFTDKLTLLALLIAGQFLVGYAQSAVNALLGQRVVRDLRQSLFKHLLTQEAAYFSTHPSGVLTNRITNDTEAVSQMVSAGLINLLGDSLLLVAILLSMMLLSVPLALVFLAALPVLVSATMFSARRMRLVQRQGRILQARIASHLTEEIEGNGVVRLCHRQEEQHRRFDKINREYRDTALKANFFEAFQLSFVEAAATFMAALIFWYGAHLADQQAMTIGVVVAFLDYIRRIFLPIRDLSNKFTTMQSAMTALERVFATLDRKSRLTNAVQPRDWPTSAPGMIQFCQVSFDYGQGNILHDIDLTIQPGERVAIAGPTGSGKSTLIKLVNRLHDPTAGKVLLDGVDVRDLSLTQLRQRVGLVSQETFLFAGTILDNICLGDPTLTEQQARWAAEQSGALSFIQDLPDGFYTQLVERGVNLSVGQRQLLGIARVLVFNPAILIMDEATSSVDTITERILQEAMRRLLAKRTALIVAHRLSTILDADRILVLSKGRIVEQGNHDSLLVQGGLYARLYALQFQESGVSVGSRSDPKQVV